MSPHGRSILVVDPDPCILDLLHLALTEMGFLPRTAISVVTALAASRVQPPDLALIDMDVDGWPDLIAGLETLNPQVRCCLVDAGVGGTRSAEELTKLGVHQRFCKPFTLEQLKNALIEEA